MRAEQRAAGFAAGPLHGAAEQLALKLVSGLKLNCNSNSANNSVCIAGNIALQSYRDGN